VRFLVDMPLSPDLAAWLKQQDHDAVHATELGLHGADDSEIIKRAKTDGRTIVTADLDYPRLLAQAAAIEPSIILFRDGEWSDRDVIVRMGELLAALAEADIEQSVIVIERDRIRRRRLPLRG
jgi:predicted nuclease of predicted toxin-antitoxin system